MGSAVSLTSADSHLWVLIYSGILFAVAVVAYVMPPISRDHEFKKAPCLWVTRKIVEIVLMHQVVFSTVVIAVTQVGLVDLHTNHLETDETNLLTVVASAAPFAALLFAIKPHWGWAACSGLVSFSGIIAIFPISNIVHTTMAFLVAIVMAFLLIYILERYCVKFIAGLQFSLAISWSGTLSVAYLVDGDSAWIRGKDLTYYGQLLVYIIILTLAKIFYTYVYTRCMRNCCREDTIAVANEKDSWGAF